MVGSFNSKARAEDKIELVISPIINPFIAQFIESADFLKILMSV
jgi:hypothetical protein